MTVTFTQPRDKHVPPVQAPGVDDPTAYNLFRHYESDWQARNVYILDDGTVTEEFPPATYNEDGSLDQTGDDRIVRGFVGTGPHEISAEERAILEAAGYDTSGVVDISALAVGTAMSSGIALGSVLPSGPGVFGVATGTATSEGTVVGTVISPPPGVVISTLKQTGGEPEGTDLYDIDGDGFDDFIIAANTSILWCRQSSTWRGTFGRQYTIGTLTGGGEAEGYAVGEVDGDVQIIVTDQPNGEVVGFRPATPATPTGTWTKTVLSTAYDNVHTVAAYDWDGDGDDEFIFCSEGTDKVVMLDFDGADPNVAADWTAYEIFTGGKPRTLVHGCPTDIMGNGRGDLITVSRTAGGDDDFIILTAPADPTDIPWADTPLPDDGPTGWAGLADIDGTGDQLDVVTCLGDDNIVYWLASESYSTKHTMATVALPVDWQIWNIFAFPDPGAVGPDDIVYIVGETAGGNESQVGLLTWGGASWQDTYPVLTSVSLPYGHPLESRFQGGTGLVTGQDRYEIACADSGGTYGGGRMAMMRFYGQGTALSKEAPTLTQVASNSNTGTTALTVTFSSTPVEDSLLLAFGSYASDTRTLTPPSGWEPVQILKSGTGWEVWAKLAGASELTAQQWTKVGGSTNLAVTMFEFAGVDTDDPFITWGRSAMQADEIGALAVMMWNWSAAQSGNPTLPAGFTERSYRSQSKGHATGTKTLDAIGETIAFDATLAVPEAFNVLRNIGVLLRGSVEV